METAPRTTVQFRPDHIRHLPHLSFDSGRVIASGVGTGRQMGRSWCSKRLTQYPGRERVPSWIVCWKVQNARRNDGSVASAPRCCSLPWALRRSWRKRVRAPFHPPRKASTRCFRRCRRMPIRCRTRSLRRIFSGRSCPLHWPARPTALFATTALSSSASPTRRSIRTRSSNRSRRC